MKQWGGSLPNMVNTLSSIRRVSDFQEEIQLEILRQLHKTPEVSQRALAEALGVSLGSINFCIQALVKKGCIKMNNFCRSAEKLRYVYVLTPTGLAEKAKLTSRFLKQKTSEYERLQRDIESLTMDLARADH